MFRFKNQNCNDIVSAEVIKIKFVESYISKEILNINWIFIIIYLTLDNFLIYIKITERKHILLHFIQKIYKTQISIFMYRLRSAHYPWYCTCAQSIWFHFNSNWIKFQNIKTTYFSFLVIFFSTVRGVYEHNEAYCICCINDHVCVLWWTSEKSQNSR